MDLISGRLNEVLRGKVIEQIRLAPGKEKLTNAELPALNRRTAGRIVECAYRRGHWVVLQLSNGENLLFTHRLVSKIAFHEPGAQRGADCDILVAFTDGGALTIRFPLGGRFFVANDPSLPKGKKRRKG